MEGVVHQQAGAKAAAGRRHVVQAGADQGLHHADVDRGAQQAAGDEHQELAAVDEQLTHRGS
jgi:hypothetical protein